MLATILNGTIVAGRVVLFHRRRPARLIPAAHLRPQPRGIANNKDPGPVYRNWRWPPFLPATCPFGSGSSTFSQVDRTVKQVAPSESDDNGTGIARSGRLDRQHIGMVRLCDLRLPFAHDIRPLFPGQGRDSFHSGCFCGIRGRISNNPNAAAALRCASFGCLRQKTR